MQLEGKKRRIQLVSEFKDNIFEIWIPTQLNHHDTVLFSGEIDIGKNIQLY